MKRGRGSLAACRSLRPLKLLLTQSPLAAHGPKDQTEQQTQQQACHQRNVQRDIIPLDHKVARQPPQSNPSQIGSQQPDHQDCKAEHDEKARHRRDPCEGILVSIGNNAGRCHDGCQIPPPQGALTSLPRLRVDAAGVAFVRNNATACSFGSGVNDRTPIRYG
jgi:hypothetical protein